MTENIVGIGELLWDLFPDGRRPGGAPFNFAWHARMLGAQGSVISRVGVDPPGDELLDLALNAGFPPGLIQRDPHHPTGTVQVHLADGQPSYTITEGVAWDFIEPAEDALAAVRAADVLCFGSLACRSAVSAASIARLISEARDACVIFDVNLRQHFYTRSLLESSLRAAHVVKLNADELGTLGAMVVPGLPPARTLVRRYDLRWLVETLGPDGCNLHSPSACVHFHGFPIRLVDAVGAGDAFTAALAVGIARGRDLPAFLPAANLLGAFVASHRGATHRYSADQLKDFASRFPDCRIDALFDS